jgi:hypothetical protein
MMFAECRRRETFGTVPLIFSAKIGGLWTANLKKRKKERKRKMTAKQSFFHAALFFIIRHRTYAYHAIQEVR